MTSYTISSTLSNQSVFFFCAALEIRFPLAGQETLAGGAPEQRERNRAAPELRQRGSGAQASCPVPGGGAKHDERELGELG